jgi:glycosyltransferase involved in cell wall biosynthesis
VRSGGRRCSSPRRAGKAGSDVEDVDGWRFHHAAREPASLGRRLFARDAGECGASRLAQDFDADILHAHSPVLNALPALRAGRRLGIPVVYDFVRSGRRRRRPRHDHGRPSLSLRALKHALRRAVITTGQGLRREIVDRGIPAGRVTVIPNAVDAREFRFGAAPDPSLRGKLGLTGATVIGFAALSTRTRASISCSRRRRCCCHGCRTCVSSGGRRSAGDALKAQAAHLSLGVVFTGRVPHADVQRYYDLIDGFYPKAHAVGRDRHAVKPLEAMAQGRMFVASDVGGHHELVRDSQTGFLFPADDARALAQRIHDVLSRRDDWPHVRAEARRFVESERTWARSVARYEDVYSELLAGGVRDRRLHVRGA